MMKLNGVTKLLVAISLLMVLYPASQLSQSPEPPKTAVLAARRVVDGVDNYTSAAFSFKHGVNGDQALKVTRNNWDLLFGNNPDRDEFSVTMVADDRSRIKDLGPLEWSDVLAVPLLPAHPEPTREPSVRAVIGHMYVVHTKDRDNDHYAMFRVEALEPGKSVTISWKLVASPEFTTDQPR
jgi:hypothetical protein